MFLVNKYEIARGNWIGASDKKRLIYFLNVGFKACIPKQNYRLSRSIETELLL
jgi:hypothetical protein